jgi:hypothetical protein
MKQQAKGQLPGIDLTFADGKNGRIWGVSGIDDYRGASFSKAADYLRDRAESDDVFDWTIDIDLELATSFAVRPLLNLIFTLDKLVKQDPDGGRSAKIVWHVRSGDQNMEGIANDVKKTIQKDGGRGVQIEIKDAVRSTRR